MRTIFFLFSFFFVIPTFAGEWYVGGAMGQSHLNYDLKGEAYEYLATDTEALQITALVQTLGGQVGVDSNQDADYQKLFFGYKVNDYWGVEAFYVRIDNYQASAHVSASARPSASGGSYQISAYGNVNGTYTAATDFKGYGLRFNGYVPITKNLDFLAGIGLMRAESNATARYNVDVDYGYRGGVVGYQNEGVESYHDAGSDNNVYSGPVPVFALGLQYKFTDHLTVRGELERYGHPIENLSIDTISVGVQYTF